ncbi:MAG: lipopolysaccharide kinase InaA family protein [Planctomycetota bacterium]
MQSIGEDPAPRRSDDAAGPWPPGARVLKRGARRTVVDLGADAGQVVKVLHGGALRDFFRARGEARATHALRLRGVRTPALFHLERAFGGRSLRFERVEGARSLRDALGAGAKRALVPPLVALLTELHRARAAHPDLHPGNVLFDRAGDAWVIDVRGTGLSANESAWRGSVAGLCGSLRERHPGFVAAAARALAEALPGLDLSALAREARVARARATRRRVRVWLRSSGETDVEADGTVRVRPGVADAPPGWETRHVDSGPAAWGTLVRAHLHGLQAAIPRATGRSWVECAVPPGAREVERPPSAGLARALAWRGLGVRGPLLEDEGCRTWLGPRSTLHGTDGGPV